MIDISSYTFMASFIGAFSALFIYDSLCYLLGRVIKYYENKSAGNNNA